MDIEEVRQQAGIAPALARLANHDLVDICRRKPEVLQLLQSAQRNLIRAADLADKASTPGRPAVGWRGFRVVRWPDGKIVLEGRHEKPWLEPVLHGVCDGRYNRADIHGHLMSGICTCGIYAYNRVSPNLYEEGCLHISSSELIVQVLGWGAVAFHEWGWRAEHVRVVAGWVPRHLALLEMHSPLTALVRHGYNRARPMPRVASVSLEPTGTFVTLDMLREIWPTVEWQEGLPELGVVNEPDR